MHFPAQQLCTFPAEASAASDERIKVASLCALAGSLDATSFRPGDPVENNDYDDDDDGSIGDSTSIAFFLDVEVEMGGTFQISFVCGALDCDERGWKFSSNNDCRIHDVLSD